MEVHYHSLCSPFHGATRLGGVLLHELCAELHLSALAFCFFSALLFVGLSSLPTGHVLFLVVLTNTFPKGVKLMEWTAPQHEEIDLNCEVSSYANAEL